MYTHFLIFLDNKAVLEVSAWSEKVVAAILKVLFKNVVAGQQTLTISKK